MLISLVICASAILEAKGTTTEDHSQADSGSEPVKQINEIVTKNLLRADFGFDLAKLPEFLHNTTREFAAVQRSLASLKATNTHQNQRFADLKETVEETVADQLASLKATNTHQDNRVKNSIAKLEATIANLKATNADQDKIIYQTKKRLEWTAFIATQCISGMSNDGYIEFDPRFVHDAPTKPTFSAAVAGSSSTKFIIKIKEVTTTSAKVEFTSGVTISWIACGVLYIPKD